MGDVVPLRVDCDGPYLSGTAKCIDCGNEWIAVAPVGTLYLECPHCKTKRGVMNGPCDAADGEQLYVCNCGCDLFKIVAVDNVFKWMICLRCGTSPTF